MRRLLPFGLTALVCMGGVASAQADTEHLRGTVTKVARATITIQATDNQTRTITIDPKAMIMRGNAHLTVRDVKVGDRVVLDVDRTGSVATGVELETAAAAPASRAPQSQPPSARPSQAEKPAPPVGGAS